jgi:hypothetical protein
MPALFDICRTARGAGSGAGVDTWRHVCSACAHGSGIRGHDDVGCHDRLLAFSRRLYFAIRRLDARAEPVEFDLSERAHVMRLHSLFTIATVILSLAAGNALAQDEKATKQAEIRKATSASLEKFYKAEPKLKGEVAKAPGYAVFTTYGLSFIIGGAGGKGLVHDSKTKRITYMDMAQAAWPYRWTEPNKYGKQFVLVGLVPQSYVATARVISPLGTAMTMPGNRKNPMRAPICV